MRLAVFCAALCARLLLPIDGKAADFPVDLNHLTSQVQVEAADEQPLGATDRQVARLLLPLALDLIENFEQWADRPYNDASYFCTIGYGHLIKKARCETLTVELSKFQLPLAPKEGQALLDTDSAIARRAVQSLVTTSLTDEQFGALASFVFNVGAKSFASSTLLAYVNNDEPDQAARQFARWVKSKGLILPGLVTRRHCESALFRGVLQPDRSGRFNRGDCAALGAAPETENLIDITIGEGH